MARGDKFVTLYDPDGFTVVEVTEERGKMLQEARGYVDKKPRDFGKAKPKASRNATADNSAELADKDAEIERLRAELDAATAPADPPKK